jgi:hypothetical protein
MKKFHESLNTAVFTTRYVIEEKSPILFVIHDNDGSWQFHGSENNLNDDDIRIAALSEIIKFDPSILEIADLPEGCEAMRSDKNASWKVINTN